MISLLAAAVLAVGQGATDRKVELPEAGGTPPRLVYTVRGDRLDPPKLCPKRFGDPPTRWEFDWEVDGLGTVGGLGDLRQRRQSNAERRRIAGWKGKGVFMNAKAV